MARRPWLRASVFLLVLVIANAPTFAAGRRVARAATPSPWKEAAGLASELLRGAFGRWGIPLKLDPGVTPAPQSGPSASSTTNGDTDRGAGMDPWG
jgi:hypothetical protein